MNGYDPGILENAFEDVWTSHLSDPEFRSRMDEDPESAVAEKGLVIPPEMDVRFHVNTRRTMHIVFPPNPNATLSDETLQLIAGGVGAGLASMASSFGSFAGCVACVRSGAPAERPPSHSGGADGNGARRPA